MMRASGMAIGRRRAALLVPLAVLVTAMGLSPSSARAQADVVGEWQTLPSLMPINPIHAGLMRTGKVLVIAGSENDSTVTEYRSAVWEPSTGAISIQSTPWDLFCNGMSFLPDGRAIVTGGTEFYDPFRGLKTTTIFDPLTERFIQVQDMAHGRWYPTTTTLADGRTQTFSGIMEAAVGGGTNKAIEIYDVSAGWSPEFIAPWTPPLYPWPHLLPSGDVFVSGPNAATHMFHPSTVSWTLNVGGTKAYTTKRTFGTSILLPLLPEDGYAARMMIAGGSNPATNTAEIIDFSEITPIWRSLPPMAYARIELSGTILPTVKVLVTGGSVQDNVASTASRHAELFDPATGTWTTLAPASFPRLYHSVALLLPDARVWTAGSNPSRGTYEKQMEIYSPPYLFTRNETGQVVPAPRPQIVAAPAVVGYGEAFVVESPDAADIASIALIRPGAATHAFDMEQRMVGLSFLAVSAPQTTLTVNSPPSSSIAPPGYYMLFLVNSRGVPSVAAFVQVSPTPDNQPPEGIIASPASDVTVAAGTPVFFSGGGTDADGSVTKYSWVFPGGTPVVSTAASPGSVVFSTPGTSVVSLTVTDNEGANDPSPPTRTITVVPEGLPDLVETTVNGDLPASVTPGASFVASDAVQNQGQAAAGPTTTRFYLSLDTTRDSGDKLLSGSRAVPGLGVGDQSTGDTTVTVPADTAAGTYRLLACANDTGAIAESNTGNNCTAHALTVTVEVARPDLAATAVSSPATTVKRGSAIQVTDTVVNQGTAPAGSSRTRYYLSTNTIKDNTDKRLNGNRQVPQLGPGQQSTGSVTVTVHKGTTPGTYYLLGCADDTNLVVEGNEVNNCVAAAAQVSVTK